MKQLVLENHKTFLDRIAYYKQYDYDITQERCFVIEKAKPFSGRILEVGTGKGYFALALAQQSYAIISVDVSDTEQEFARPNLAYYGLEKHVRFEIGNAECLTFSNNSFDTIFSVNMIHHTSRPFVVMDELIRLMSKKGKIVLSDFNAAGLGLMSKIHESEGRKHEVEGVALSAIHDYCIEKGFKTQTHTSTFQDVLIINR